LSLKIQKLKIHLLNSYQQRKAYWEKLLNEVGINEIEHALSNVQADTTRVLRWHYLDNYTFKEIAHLLNRSISIVRNHHDRGVYKLHKHFSNCHSF
jgi:DNA-directed RNA polymerase specialized sigma24 family protein